MSTINLLSVPFVAALLQTLKPSLCPSRTIIHELILKCFERIALQIRTYLSVFSGHFAESVLYNF